MRSRELHVLTRDGLDVIIRVMIIIGNEGDDHLKIFKTIVTGDSENCMLNTNHTTYSIYVPGVSESV